MHTKARRFVNLGTSNIEHRTSNIEGIFPRSPEHHLTPALSPTPWRRGRRNPWLASIQMLSANILLGGFFALTASAAVPPVEKLLPDDTLFMVTTPDYTKARETYHSSAQTQLWDDPAMKPFKEKFMAKLSENLIQPLEKDLGVQFNDYTNLPQGQITFAVTQNGWPMTDGAQAGLLFLLDTKDKSGQLTKNLSDLRKKWLDAGKTLRTEKIRNIDFSVLPISDKDIPKTLKKFSGPEKETDADQSDTNAPKREIYIGQAESLLIIGTAAKPIEKILVHVAGGEMPALGDLAAYEANRLALFRDSSFYGWVNTKSLLDLFTRKQAKDDAETPDPFAMFNPTKILAAVGFNNLKSLAFSTQVSNEGSTVQLFGSIPSSGRGGIFAVFPGETKDSTPPPFVPADTAKFQRWRVDGKKAWDTLQKILNDISPQAKNAITFAINTANSAAKEKDPDFDMDKNFFGNLGDDLISYEKAPRGTSAAELKSAPGLLLIGSPNPDKLVSAFQYILLLTNPQGAAPKDREFLGRKIYSAPLPGAAALGQGPAAPGASRTLNYAASSGYVAFSTDASMVEEYLRSSDSQQKALRETPGLTDAIAKAGGSSTGLFGYENQAETSRAVFEALRTSPPASNTGNPAMAMLGLGSLPSAGTFKDWMDFSLLPPFDKISKYFGFEVYTVSSTPDGVLFKMYAPVPAGLRK
jgi:hypothetical protein